MHMLEWLKDHIVALILANLATLIAAVTSAIQWKSAKDGLKISSEASEASRRSADAAEAQLEEARLARGVAERAAENAERRAVAAESREGFAMRQAELAHEQMKIALEPVLVLKRMFNNLRGQWFEIENVGKGPARDITYDFFTAQAFDLLTKNASIERLSMGAGTNLISANSSLEFLFNYEKFQKELMVFRYTSADGRIFYLAVRCENSGKFVNEYRQGTIISSEPVRS